MLQTTKKHNWQSSLFIISPKGWLRASMECKAEGRPVTMLPWKI